MENFKRKKISILFLSKPDFDEYACKFLVLNLNKIQNCFEFVFPEVREHPFQGKNHYDQIDIHKDFLDILQKKEIIANYFIGITNAIIGPNLYWTALDNKAIITTGEWQKYFVPPSVFEYIIHSIVSSLICIIDFSAGIGSHKDTRGCCLDYTFYKRDKKGDIGLGYICDNCKTKIIEKLGKEYLECFETINSLEWLGDVTKRGTIASDMIKYFKIDLDKDTGYYKTFWEKVKEHFSMLPKDIILTILNAIIAALVALAVSK